MTVVEERYMETLCKCLPALEKEIVFLRETLETVENQRNSLLEAILAEVSKNK